MNPALPGTTTNVTTGQRVRLRMWVARRRVFWRRVAIFTVATIGMLLLALANRDNQHWRSARKEAAAIVAVFQEKFEARGQLLLRFPDLQPPYDRYDINILYAEQQKWHGRAGVCVQRAPTVFYFRSAGRIVIVFDGKKFGWEWLTEPEFQDRADSFGFGSLSK